jgi:hypothetical protein
MSLTPRQVARYTALNTITKILRQADSHGGYGTVPAFRANQFNSPRDIQMIQKEYDSIIWQLENRAIKLEVLLSA